MSLHSVKYCNFKIQTVSNLHRLFFVKEKSVGRKSFFGHRIRTELLFLFYYIKNKKLIRIEHLIIQIIITLYG